MAPVVLSIVGGGAFAPRLCEVLAEAVNLPRLEIRLSARRRDRLQILAAHAASRVAPIRPGWSVRAADSVETAAAGATIVVLLVRVGGFEARAWDDEFPRRFGLPGDEGLGPGGIANAWRTLPELTRMAGILRRTAPRARILNLMAPLGVTTRCLLDLELDAVGLCELPQVTIESWLRQLGSPGAVSWRYAGLNHLGWFWDVRRDDENLLPRLVTISTSGSDNAPIDSETIEQYEAAPLRYFYDVFDRKAGARLGLRRSANRATQLREITETLIERFATSPGSDAGEAQARPTPWLDRAVAPVTSALLGGPAWAGFANLRNNGLIPELPPELVVEVRAKYSAAGVSPVKPGPLPDRVADFLRQIGEAESLTYRASVQRDPELLEDAIRALPLPIPPDAVSELARLAQRDPESLPRTEEHR